MSAAVNGAIDHLVLATPDLELGIAHVENLVGARAALGGRHEGRGTWNALLSLGTDVYLEIIAPDPAQPDPPTPRVFGLDEVTAPRLARWAARSTSLEDIIARANRIGVDLGTIKDGRRRRADGVELAWRYTDPAVVAAGGLIPFFIDWGTSPHPALTAPTGARLVELRGEHPEATSVGRQLDGLGIRMAVTGGRGAALVALIEGARGLVELR